MKVAIYARVSTDGQSVNAQLADLREVAERRGWEVVHEYTDKGISGAKGRDQRPALEAMMKAAVQRKFDLVAVWKLDRFGRSVQHLVNNLEELRTLGVDFYAHDQAIDTSSAQGKLTFHIIAAFAEFERDMISERVRAGIKNAQKNGTKSGKPIGRPRVNKDTERRVRELRAQDWGINRIARELGVGSGTVRRIANG